MAKDYRVNRRLVCAVKTGRKAKLDSEGAPGRGAARMPFRAASQLAAVRFRSPGLRVGFTGVAAIMSGWYNRAADEISVTHPKVLWVDLREGRAYGEKIQVYGR